MDHIDSNTHNWLSSLISGSFQIETPDWSTQKNIYKVVTPDKIYYLRIAVSLEKEHENLKHVKPFLNVPAVVGFRTSESGDQLLMSEVPGKNLCEFINNWTNEDITKKFARAVKDFHTLDPLEIFPETTSPTSIVLHGDMSLPNVIFTESDFSGYIDLGQMSVGSPDEDLADALWSLQRNIGPEYGELFLHEYGEAKMTPKLVAALNFRYTP
jgi:aminoglycoside phosphotransferase